MVTELMASWLKQEAGGHRWQRVPPTERQGRVHTSTVTVAVLSERETEQVRVQDIRVEARRGTGPGGQKRNKTMSDAVAIHEPSGIRNYANGRHHQVNRKNALDGLYSRLESQLEQVSRTKLNNERQQQVGSGERGDKIRTYRVKDDSVCNHPNNRKVRLKDVLAGRLDLLWEVN